MLRVMFGDWGATEKRNDVVMSSVFLKYVVQQSWEHRVTVVRISCYGLGTIVRQRWDYRVTFV